MNDGLRGAWVAAAAAAATFLGLPLATFGVVVWWHEGFVRLSAFLAEEEMRGALRTASPREIWDAAVLYVNFTRGALNAQIARVTVGQALLSVALGTLVGLNLMAARRRRAAAIGSGFGAGAGVVATLCAATAGAFGCCAGGVGVSLVASLGVSVPLAGLVAQAAWPVQLVTVTMLAVNLARLRRRPAWAAVRLGG